MIAGIADTHTFIWYLDRDPHLSHAARAWIDNATLSDDVIGVSPITLVEAIYLIEKRRIPADTLPRKVAELTSPESVFVEIPFDLDVAQALTRIDRAQIPDMPDRIIAATALHAQAPIISRDGRIRVAGIETVW